MFLYFWFGGIVLLLRLLMVDLMALAYLNISHILGYNCVKSVSKLFLHVRFILVVIVKRAVTLIYIKIS